MPTASEVQAALRSGRQPHASIRNSMDACRAVVSYTECAKRGATSVTAAPSTPITPGDPLSTAYRTDSRRLIAHRAPLAAVVLLVASAVGSGIDAFYYPQRTATLAIGLA